LLGLLVAVGLPAAGRAAEPRFQFRASAIFETGRFGTRTTTNTLFVPFTLRYLGRTFDLGVTVPVLRQESGPGVIAVEGVPTVVREEEEEEDAALPGAPPRAARRTASGLGDVVLRGRYYLTDERGPLPALTPFARVKFPTADETRGLGTGELDYGFGVELDKRLGRAGLFADFGYTVRGDPPGLELRNQFAYGAGLAVDLTSTLRPSLSVEGRTAAVRGRADPLDLFLDLAYRLSPTSTLTAGVSVGLSNGSPDLGVSLGHSVRF
ncbi:MAG TPA: transporter, partial [Thermodesulfobacteriota bacterium]|nr:transporter [Thermodesulfobacteriota bacterium]